MSLTANLELLVKVLRSEGWAGARNRLRDRLATGRRRRRFPTVASDTLGGPAAPSPLAEVPVLNVLATQPRPDLGGVQVQLLRRLAAEAHRRPRALLYPDGGGYRLEVESGSLRAAVELRAPSGIPVPELSNSDFEWAISRAVARVGAEIVHFEQVLGWPLASVARLRAKGLKLVLSVHDFGLFCLRPHLIERPRPRFCDYSRDAERCARCLRCTWTVEEGFQESRREVARQLLRDAEAVIYPSDFLRRTYRQLMPGLDAARQWVVEPPSVRQGAEIRLPPRRPEVRHIAYVGSVKPHKGALIFEQLVRRFPPSDFPQLRWTVYGGGDAEILSRLKRLPAVRLRGYYRADRLPEQLVEDRVDLALLLSIWPEAYALTFDECHLAGVPVVAFNHGAIADRMQIRGGGELVSPSAGVDGLTEKVRQLIEQPAKEVAVSGELPDGGTAADKVCEIYRSLSALLACLMLVLGCREDLSDHAELPPPSIAAPGQLAPLAIVDSPVILISIDTLRADHLGCYGYPLPITPEIDRFRRDAVLFEQAIAQAPSTLPSHASMLSSLWPEHHGAFFMRKTALPASVLTLPEVLAEHGYSTAGFNGGGQMAPEFGLGQGFELYQVVGRAANTLETVRRGKSWIESHGEEPFFLFLHTYEVHHPYTPRPAALRDLAPEYRGSLPSAISKNLIAEINRGERQLEAGDLDYIIAAYDAEIRSMDAALGRFFDFLRQRELYDRSIIVLTSDHGEEFGEHGKVGWHSHTLFDELLRVPLIVKLPASKHAGRSISTQVRSIDLPPTVLSLLGHLPPAEFEGFDLRQVIENVGFDPGLPALSQQDTVTGIDHSSLRLGDWKLYPNRLFHMQRLGGGDRLGYLRARLAWTFGKDRLYNLASDPDERFDLAGRERGVRRRLRTRRARLKAEHSAPASETAVANPETLERLRALGYLD